jgi:hypothetical protein
MNTATTTPRPVPVRIDAPNAKDECDRCMQPALWRVMFATGKELLFCGHHAQKYGFAGKDESHAHYQNENKQKGSDH